MKEHLVGIGSKISNMTEELTGKIKSMAGKAVDDEQLEAEGDADQVKGNVKQAGEKVKDVFQD